jgi:hypothetical protein
MGSPTLYRIDDAGKIFRKELLHSTLIKLFPPKKLFLAGNVQVGKRGNYPGFTIYNPHH